MKKSIALIITLLLVLSACDIETPPESNPTPSPTAAATTPALSTPETTVQPTEEPLGLSDYFPFTEDTHMVYAGSGNEFAEFTTSVDFLTTDAMQVRTVNSGTVSVSVYVLENGTLTRVYSEGESYYRLDYTAVRDTDDIVLKEPLAVGTAWTLEDGSTRSITAVGVPVTVPYGSFEALEVTTEYADSTIKEYYAPGIGLVKREFVSKADLSSPITSELESMVTGAPEDVTMRFYFPDFNNDRIVYVDRDIPFHTGDTLQEALEAELKEIPQGSSLIPVLSADASILSLNYDAATGIITVDLSEEFITGMNAGSALEGMILDSLADTLGNYFMISQVGITIEGESYSSGAIVIEKGEYWTADWQDAEAY